ncbi:MAG: fatty acid oxidation complex subunit alpha FadJ [Acidobacteria bacterium]|nr:fatty acid oxidation complex subunit alpha FadJ [Acidobacteriota bacterium]
MRDREPGSPYGARLASDAVGISLDIDEDGIAVIEFDQPGAPHNRLSSVLLERFVELVTAVRSQADAGNVQGVIIASGKADSFIAGLDVAEIAGARGLTAARSGSRRGQLAFDALADLPVTTVAAINGTCVGGATELALACDFRLAADNEELKIGLPEVQLGIIPGFGGTQRLPRLISLERALSMVLSGRLLGAREAHRIGLVDEVVPGPLLLQQAARWCRRRPEPGRRVAPEDRGLWRRLRRWATEGNPIGRAALFRRADADVTARTKGHHPAPRKAIRAIRAGLTMPLDAGLRFEADLVAETVISTESRNLVGLFFLRQAARRGASRGARVRRLVVLGAGIMGGGIAQVAAHAGVQVRIKDVERAPLAVALRVARRRFASLRRRGRLSAAAAAEGWGRISATRHYDGFARSDLVIEAVVEELAIKHEVLAAAEKAAGPTAVLATNTSSLTVASMAVALERPERFLGLHFFNPVHRMPLVEIVRGPESADDAVCLAHRFVTELGKVPVVVGDAPGFFVNRVLVPYVNEAVVLLEQGNSVTAIDEALESFGMPMGPLRLLDEIGLDVATKVTALIAPTYDAGLPATSTAASLVAEGRLGRKSGQGFYSHDGGGNAAPVAELPAPDSDRDPLAPVDIVDRCVLAMLNAAAGALGAGIVASAPQADLALVLGTGFAPFRGGIFRYAESRGVEAVRDRMAELSEREGSRFQPVAALDRRRFYPGNWPTRVETL